MLVEHFAVHCLDHGGERVETSYSRLMLDCAGVRPRSKWIPPYAGMQRLKDEYAWCT